MEAVVLAGGKGTRLQSVVSDVPKPMALIGERPFLALLLEYLRKNGITRVILAVGYKWKIIEEYFGDDYKGMKLLYSVESEPLGTGGALAQAMQEVLEDEVYLLNGDTFFNIPLATLNLSKTSKLQLALKKMYDFDRYACVESDEKNFVTNFREKNYTKVGNINGGVYLMRRDIFDDFTLEKKFSFEEFMEKNFKELNMSSKEFENYFIDIGIPSDYERAQIEIGRQI